jgi:hypothetical protein
MIRLLDRRLAPRPRRAIWKRISARSRPAGATPCCLRSRERLAAVLLDASAPAGWQAIGMGQLPRAWEHFERATAAAREAGDTCLMPSAEGRAGLRPARPAPDQGRVRHGPGHLRRDLRHRPTPGTRLLRAAEAEMAAAAGLANTCRRALDYAANETGHGPSSADLPYLALKAARLIRWRGNFLVMFGDRRPPTS